MREALPKWAVSWRPGGAPEDPARDSPVEPVECMASAAFAAVVVASLEPAGARSCLDVDVSRMALDDLLAAAISTRVWAALADELVPFIFAASWASLHHATAAPAPSLSSASNTGTSFTSVGLFVRLNRRSW